MTDEQLEKKDAEYKKLMGYDDETLGRTEAVQRGHLAA